MQIALVSRTGAILDAYRHFFDLHGIKLLHTISIAELYQKLPETIISGFVVDVQAVVRATEMEKVWLQAMQRVFPNIKTNWNPELGFRALFNDGSKSGEDNLIAFLQHCHNFKARTLRKVQRYAINYNVLFWPTDGAAEAARRAYTADISPRGLFICTCDPPSPGSLLSIKILEIDAGPFKAVAMWRLEWGIVMRIPGVGCSFIELSRDCVERLEAAIKLGK